MSNVLGKMTVAESRSRIKSEGIVGNIIRSDDIFDHFFPENDTVRKVMPALKHKNKPLLKNDAWRLLPLSSNESSVLQWFSTMRESVNRALADLRIPMFQERHLEVEPDSSMEDGSEPDGILLSLKTLAIKPYQRRLRQDDSVPTWGQVLVPIEHKKSHGQLSEAKDQICDRARRVFFAQSSRYHCFGVIFTEFLASVLYFDRRGVVQTQQFNCLKEPTTLIRLLVGFATLSDEEMGLSSDYTKDDNAAVSMEFNGANMGRTKIMNLEVLRPSSELVGRCTNLFRGEMDGKAIVVKETFQHPDRPHEGEILAKVHSRNGGQACNVPKCIDFEEDQDVLPNLEITRRAIENETWVPRVRRRIILEEHLKDVRRGSTPECLLIAADGALSGILACKQADIVHCDISQGNVMLTQNEEEGILIDFDVAYDLTAEAAKTHRSGTPPFMSIRMLSNNSSVNTHEDDIELVFWTVLWITFTSNGPEKMPPQCPVTCWHDLEMCDLARVKQEWISDLNMRLRDMTLFYAPLKNVILEMKKIVFDEEKGTVEGTIEKLKRAIREARETLVDGGRVFNGVEWTERGAFRLPQD
ncbi:hypothetical protein KEM56_006706 [Ascosphaera pollenicola]|nr:hypothetical protein KEM56_006706 [Ascosphaera pollenicola]